MWLSDTALAHHAWGLRFHPQPHKTNKEKQSWLIILTLHWGQGPHHRSQTWWHSSSPSCLLLGVFTLRGAWRVATTDPWAEGGSFTEVTNQRHFLCSPFCGASHSSTGAHFWSLWVALANVGGGCVHLPGASWTPVCSGSHGLKAICLNLAFRTFLPEHRIQECAATAPSPHSQGRPRLTALRN